DQQLLPALEASEATREIVFVDASVTDHAVLIEEIQRQRAEGRAIEVVLLDSSQDGLEQITAVLQQHHDLSAIHIVSHATDGALRLGNVWLTTANVDEYRDTISAWGESLESEADLLLYGCDLAGSES